MLAMHTILHQVKTIFSLPRFEIVKFSSSLLQWPKNTFVWISSPHLPTCPYALLQEYSLCPSKVSTMSVFQPSHEKTVKSTAVWACSEMISVYWQPVIMLLTTIQTVLVMELRCSWKKTTMSMSHFMPTPWFLMITITAVALGHSSSFRCEKSEAIIIRKVLCININITIIWIYCTQYGQTGI